MNLLFSTLLIAAASTIVVPSAIASVESAPKSTKHVKCDVCRMNVDVKHKIHFRYVHNDKSVSNLGSLTCAKKYWSKNQAAEMRFEAQDFVTAKWIDARKGHYLVGAKLNVGTGMDRGGAVFFADRSMALKAQAANGGDIVDLDRALKS